MFDRSTTIRTRKTIHHLVDCREKLMSHAERSTERILQAALKASMKTKNAKQSVTKRNYWLELGCKSCILYRVDNLQIVIFCQCYRFCDMLFNILLYNIRSSKEEEVRLCLIHVTMLERLAMASISFQSLLGGGGGGGEGILVYINYIRVCGPK